MKAFFIRTLLILVSVVLLVQLWIFSSLVWWRTQPVQSTMMMRLDYWAEPSKPIQHQWRDYDQLSDNLKRAVVTAEDGKFMQHHGFDWEGIQTALERNKDEGTQLITVPFDLDEQSKIRESMPLMQHRRLLQF